MMDRFPTPRRPVALATALGLLTTLLVALHVTPAAAISWPLSSTPLLTWNMQGGAEGDVPNGTANSKWASTIVRFTWRFPIIMLQEAGPRPPDSAVDQGAVTVTGPSGTQHRILHHLWNAAGTRGSRHVYFALTQNGRGGRVNLALVLGAQPDEVNIVENPVQAGRIALGARFGAHWYFTVHGLSPGGGDSAGLLNAIDDRVDEWAAQAGPGIEYTWTVGGDFNVVPDSLEVRNHFPVADVIATPPNVPTHNSGNRYDYFVTTQNAPGLGDAWVDEGPPSDHRPVGLGRIRAAGEDDPDAEPQADPPSDIRLMPIGDSITEGWGSSNESGYRDELQDDIGKITLGLLLGGHENSLLWEAIEKRDLVGERRHGRGIPDTDHEGWPGYTIDQIAAEALDAVPAMRPNVVTLLAGTNDMVRDVDVADAPARLSRLIDQIFTGSPGVVIVVGTITPSTNANIQRRIEAYNDAIRTMLDDRIRRGDHLVRVSLDAVGVDDIADEVHPNDTGYRKIADAFTDGLRTALYRGWVKDPAPVDPNGSCTARGGYRPLGRVWGGLPGNPDVFGEIKFADVDGDRRDDVVWVAPTGAATVWLNRGGEAANNWVYRGEIAMGTGIGAKRVFFADLNGDRLDDYIVIRPDNVIDAYYNKGGDTTSTTGWSPGFQPHLNYGRGTDTPVERIRFADLDGDGRADYVRLLDFSTKVDVFYNRGGDVPGKDGWEAGGAPITNLPARSNAQIELVDLTCDGKADYLALDHSGVPTAWFNNGTTRWTDRGQIATGTGGLAAMPDLNGDGRADWVRIARNGAIDAWINNGGD